MESATLMPLVVAAAVVVTVVVAAVVTVVVVLAGRRRLERELRGSRAELDAVRERVEQLSEQVAPPGRHDTPDQPRQPDQRLRPVAREFVITSLSEGDDGLAERDDEALATQQLTAGQFASVAIGESLVRVLSLGYGVGRALSPENRNRIRFAMRQEVRRARRQRRHDLKEARRNLRTQAARGEAPDIGTDAADAA
jgi:hypothetical protein